MPWGAIAIGARAALQGRRGKNPRGAGAKPGTQLIEAAGLMLALRLLRVPSGSDETLRAVREGAGR
jgi:hypothetical protein